MGKLHEAGVNHGQISQMRLEHAILTDRGVRLIDFSKAEVHECFGFSNAGPSDVHLHNPGVTCCAELYKLEHTIGRRVAN